MFSLAQDKDYLEKIKIIFLPINLSMCFGCSKDEVWKKRANDMQNHEQMKKSKCAKDILKCANEKRCISQYLNCYKLQVQRWE